VLLDPPTKLPLQRSNVDPLPPQKIPRSALDINYPSRSCRTVTTTQQTFLYGQCGMNQSIPGPCRFRDSNAAVTSENRLRCRNRIKLPFHKDRDTFVRFFGNDNPTMITRWRQQHRLYWNELTPWTDTHGTMRLSGYWYGSDFLPFPDMNSTAPLILMTSLTAAQQKRISSSSCSDMCDSSIRFHTMYVAV
jgi:hypothetical protein